MLPELGVAADVLPTTVAETYNRRHDTPNSRMRTGILAKMLRVLLAVITCSLPG
jgi:hypothetical protein